MTEPALADLYRIFSSARLRHGLLLEHLDALAGDVALRHLGARPGDGTGVVTAVVERTEFRGNMTVDRDMYLAGGVSWVGRTAMEVRIRVVSVGADGRAEEHGTAVFVMVSRSGAGRGPPAPALEVSSHGQRRRLASSAVARAQHKVEDEQSVWRVPPTVSEMRVLHDMFLLSRAAGGGLPEPREETEWMDATLFDKVDIAHHQARNLNSQLFGGTLMKMALELAYSTTVAFAPGALPELTTLDNIAFLAPVPIGSVLRFTSRVAYTQPETSSVVVYVEAWIMDGGGRFRSPTNRFHFTFRAERPDGTRPRRVMPRTYQEAMLYLDARRSHRGYVPSGASAVAGAEGGAGSEL